MNSTFIMINWEIFQIKQKLSMKKQLVITEKIPIYGYVKMCEFIIKLHYVIMQLIY